MGFFFFVENLAARLIFAGGLFEARQEPVALLLAGEGRVVEHQRIGSLTQGVHFAVRVDVVALLHVLENRLVAPAMPLACSSS